MPIQNFIHGRLGNFFIVMKLTRRVVIERNFAMCYCGNIIVNTQSLRLKSITRPSYYLMYRFLSKNLTISKNLGVLIVATQKLSYEYVLKITVWVAEKNSCLERRSLPL